jgi:hypothetical protein
MVDVSALATPIGQLLEHIIGKDIWLLGLFTIILFVVFIVVRGGDLITFSAVLVPLIVVLGVSLAPSWLIIPAIVALVVVLYLGWRYLFPT